MENIGEVESKTYPFKLVLLGESAVGKSSLVMRYVKDQFFEVHESTIGAAFLTKLVPIDEKTNIKFEIWDTAGQERFRSLTPMYYRDAHAALVVYDITSRDSFQRSKSWIKELKRSQNSELVIALAGNKHDLGDKRAVPTAEAQHYFDECGVLFLETSAKSRHNVDEIFDAITKKLPLRDTSYDGDDDEDVLDVFHPPPPDNDENSNCC